MNFIQAIKDLNRKIMLVMVIIISIFTINLSACNEDKKTESNTESKEAGNNTKEQENDEEKEEAIKVRALYLTGWNAGLDDELQHFIDIVKETEINSVVLDIKDDDGYIGYETSIPYVKEFGGWKKKYNPKEVIKKLHDNNVHVIGRVVCFKDPVLSQKRPDLAIRDVNGDLFYAKGITWLDPYKRDAWSIITDTAKEGLELGFDEIQFDYLRFSNDGNRDAMAFDTGGLERYEIINEFVAYAREQMPDAVLSGDVFGIICESPADTEQIGQYLEYIGKNDLDYLSPMVYPSHYKVGQKINGVAFNKPDFEPYNVVYNTMLKARARTEQVENYRAKMRPYLQDFTATWLGDGYYKSYGAEDVRNQIQAVYDAGYEEWILWNAANDYTEEAFLSEADKDKYTPNQNVVITPDAEESEDTKKEDSNDDETEDSKEESNEDDETESE
jgi:hypothetical protein